MRKWLSAFTLIELLVVIAIIAILAGLLLPALARAREESRRKACNSNIGQIVKAATTYQEPNGDFFPAHMQYTDAPGNTAADMTYQPMPSLAILYPTYVDNVKVFGCPSTSDKPYVSVYYSLGARWTCFGSRSGDGAAPYDGNVVAGSDPVANANESLRRTDKCSYLYDERSHFRDIGPSQAMAADADGQTWRMPDGTRPPYTNDSTCIGYPAGWNWNRSPRQPNHDSGQNVMYFDGHVKWAETSYASANPKDNIFTPNYGGFTTAVDPGTWWYDRTTLVSGQWGQDTDARVWCSGNNRLVVSPSGY